MRSDVGFGVSAAAVMKSIIFWDMTPCSLPPVYLLVLAKLFLRPWRWRRYVPPKLRLQLNRLHGVISQKMILFNEIWCSQRGNYDENCPLWVTAFSLADRYQFRRNLLFMGEMEATGSSETLVTIYQVTRRHILKYTKLQTKQTLIRCTLSVCMKYEVFTAMKIHIAIFWVMTPCGLVTGYQHLGRTHCLHSQGKS
jgi:hypothetical protein